MAYPIDDGLRSKIGDVATAAGAAGAVLAGVQPGAAVLANQFTDVKQAMDALQLMMAELSSGVWYCPVGMVSPFAGPFSDLPPSGWLFCNGGAVPNGSGTVQGITANFSKLYAIVGTTYGSAGTLPDLRGRVPMGQTTAVPSGSPALPAGISARSIGVGQGSESTALTNSHIPSHHHSINHGHAHSISADQGPHSHNGFTSDLRIGSGAISSGVVDFFKPPYTSGTLSSLNVNTFTTDPAITISGGVTNHTGNSGDYGTAAPTGVPSVQPSLPLSFIIKF